MAIKIRMKEGRKEQELMRKGLNKERRILLLLPLLVLLCIGVWAVQKIMPVERIYSENGVYDLRGFDFEKGLATAWRTGEYIPGELLTPEEFAAREDIRVGHVPEGTDVVTMRVRLQYLRSLTAAIAVMTCYFLMAVIFISLYFVLPAYKANGWLALMTLNWSVCTGVMGSKPLLALLPFLDWTIGYRIEKASFPLALGFLLLALHAAFPKAFPKWPRRIFAVVIGGLVAAALLLPTRVYSGYSSGLMRMTYYLTMAALGFILWSVRKKKPDLPQGIILIGTGLLAAAYLWDIFYKYTDIFNLPFSLIQPMLLASSLFFMEAAMLHTMREAALAHERERRAEAENEMLSEMNRLKSAFYTDMSHEMKTPLTVIAVNAQFAAQNIGAGAVDEETVTDLNAISAEARRLAQMVTSLVGIGRMQGTGSGLLSLTPLLTETARIYQSLFARRQNTLTVEANPDLPTVEGSADRLIQVLINLLSNANRHTGGGTVTVRAEVLEHKVRVSVTDNGEGIAPDLLPHVFERFCHGEKGGSGLGLSICKTIIEEHGGEIDIESTEGGGTTVWFTLPVKEETNDGGDRDNPAGGGR